ncbi:putative serine/threonine-protein kinase PIX13 [Senna tora]|uniref:Putative serine/threonine-protein kinase PIX13 n=1 Tax=Senna tora TaxID=362788 RepID=A0A834W6R2_9FABA|nr:putative serine/threonine-protein kinase PIX13 [Senna tora]
MRNCWCFSANKPNSPETTATDEASRTTTNSNHSSVSIPVEPPQIDDNDEAASYAHRPNCGQTLPSPNLRIFTMAELKAATKNFRHDTVIGEGGFGIVFKGWLRESVASRNHGSGKAIAVKKLKSESLFDLSETWQSEINFIGRLSHPNLVKFLGYCREETELILVYEYMQKGSLKNHLFGRGSTVSPLPWDTRLKIAIGVARALAFLHTENIVYRDVKSSSMLLDWSYNAKLSDFGLAKLGPSDDHSHVTTRVMGTYGYAAPEYIATGLRALDPNRPTGEHSLVEWIKPYLQNRRKLKSFMDPRLEGIYPFEAAFGFAQITLKCLAVEPKQRPSMKQVLENLEQIQAQQRV